MSEDLRSERQEVWLILSWLKGKGVKEILRLVVPDCKVNPLDEDRIRRSMEGFVIKELDWRRLDLGIEPIMSLASTLSVLHLYSSGNWAVLSHWVSKGGLEELKKVRVPIYSFDSQLTSLVVERAPYHHYWGTHHSL